MLLSSKLTKKLTYVFQSGLDLCQNQLKVCILVDKVPKTWFYLQQVNWIVAQVVKLALCLRGQL